MPDGGPFLSLSEIQVFRLRIEHGRRTTDYCLTGCALWTDSVSTQGGCVQILMALFLLFRMACLRLDVSVEQCLEIWRSRPAIVVVFEERSQNRHALVGRINQMYPF